MQVPDDAYYGASTQRAVENFPISNLKSRPQADRRPRDDQERRRRGEHGPGDHRPEIRGAITSAAEEVVAGTHDRQFVLDVFQTGSGTRPRT